MICLYFFFGQNICSLCDLCSQPNCRFQSDIVLLLIKMRLTFLSVLFFFSPNFQIILCWYFLLFFISKFTKLKHNCCRNFQFFFIKFPWTNIFLYLIHIKYPWDYICCYFGLYLFGSKIFFPDYFLCISSFISSANPQQIFFLPISNGKVNT